MNYTSIDPTISAWASKHKLVVYTSHHDEEVRSTNLVGMSREKCQIWIEAPDQSGAMRVHVWDYKNKRRDFEVNMDELADCLEQVYELARKWLGLDPINE